MATSRAWSADSAGRSPGNRVANMVLPAPAGPTISRWWPPAAATSRARRPNGWPRTSARSGAFGGSSSSGPRGRSGHGPCPRRAPTRALNVAAVLVLTRGTRQASRPQDGGTTTPSSPLAATRGSMPGTRRREPSRPSSAMNAKPASGPVPTWPSAASTPSAMARSRPEPALRKPEGARLTVMRFWGQLKPLEMRAARTRSRASRHDVSGRPTTRNPGSPLLTWTSTLTA